MSAVTKRDRPDERLPWYREKTYKGNLSENEKRQLDALRMQERHPAAAWDDLPQEVQNYINRIEMDLYDRKQEALVGKTILVSVAGLLLGYLAYRGVAYSETWAYVMAAVLVVAPWLFYRRQWNKNAQDYLPSDNPNGPTEEGIRQEWELEYIAALRREPNE